MKPFLATKSEAAKFFGVSPQAVTGWIDRGAPVAERHANGRLKSVDLFELWAWRMNAHRAHISGEDVSQPLELFFQTTESGRIEDINHPQNKEVVHELQKLFAYLDGRAGVK